MRRKSVYVSKWDVKLKKKKSARKLKLTALEEELNLSEKQFCEQLWKKDGTKWHWCQACEL